MVNFDTREGIMKAWDSWVHYYMAGGGGTWPRDAFESLLDYFEEQRHLTDKSSGQQEKCPIGKCLYCHYNLKHVNHYIYDGCR